MAPETAPRSAPIALWRGARVFVQAVIALIGAPAALALEHVIDARTHKLFCAWLRAGEIIIRQLLMIEASLLPRSDEDKPRARTKRRRAPRAKTEPPLDDSAQWRVSFRCFISPSGGSGARRRERKAASRFYPSFPIAARLEALLRAFNDPAPYARRMLPRLLRQRRRAHVIVRDTPSRRLVHGPRACAEIDGLLQAAAQAATRLDTG